MVHEQLKAFTEKHRLPAISVTLVVHTFSIPYTVMLYSCPGTKHFSASTFEEALSKAEEWLEEQRRHEPALIAEYGM